MPYDRTRRISALRFWNDLSTQLRSDDGAGDRNRTRDIFITSEALYLLSYTSILNFKGRWRWGFTDSYSRRFQTANPYFSDSTPAGTNPALSDPFKVYCHVSKTRRFSRQLLPLGGLRTVYLGISTTNRFLCRHSIS